MIIAIEGLDGSGKTTQARMLVEMLNGAGHQAMYIRPLFIFVKEGSASDRISPRRARVGGSNIFRRAVLGVAGYLYALACYFKMRFGMGRGKVIVCDRYFYQFFFDLFGRSGARVAAAFPRPDMVFFLSAELNTLCSRMTSMSDRAVDRGYYQATGQLFDILSEKHGFINIDASLSQETVSDIIFGHLSGRLEK